ncbi:nitroreductase family protein [Rhodoferax sp. PAMC 29310]|uniref:nitroreductase family protein n=1 Tax=Rhodoferax sp. PAMC 29310 TaxID=2822760 RepID=UPI001F0B2A68|nr:nitroreductase family protein [Rhodoferax sp. PAMC 29310]
MSNDTLKQILDLARWAPSGDNTQPWRFELVNDHMIRVHGHDTRDHVLYDFDGHPSHMAHGALLETLRVAATGFGLKATWTAHSEGDHRHPIYEVILAPDDSIKQDPLFDCITLRTVQRRPMKTTALTDGQRQALQDAAGEGFTLQVLDSWHDRRRVANLLWASAKIRLTCPEAFPVHKAVIEWRARFSKDRIPEEAVGVDWATARLMEWAMHSWERVAFMNRYLMGTIVPRVQLDLLPGLRCAAHLLLHPKTEPQRIEDWVRLGESLQRIWLTATLHGLQLQPQMTPVIFRWYARAGRHFSADPVLFDQAQKVASEFESVVGALPTSAFGFFARVGHSPVPQSRSVRLALPELDKQ